MNKMDQEGFMDFEKDIDDIYEKYAVPPLKGENKVIVAHSFPKGVELGEIPYMELLL